MKDAISPRRFGATAAALVLTVCAGAAAAATFQGLGDLPDGGFGSGANGVSANGLVVVGRGSSPMGGEAFRWTAAGGMVGLGDINGGLLSSEAMNVSRNGLIVVGSSESDQSFMEAFRWNAPGPMNGLGFLGFPQSISRAASADGTLVVGRSGFGEPKLGGYRPFKWTQATGMQLVGDLPGGTTEGAAHDVSADGTVIVGYCGSSNGLEAFRWTQSGGMVGLGDLAGGGFSSFAYAVSADGNIVVGSGFSGIGQAMRWSTADGGMMGLGALPATNPGSRAADVSDDGSIIVGESNSQTSLLGSVAFIWDPVNGMRDLKSVLTGLGLNLTGWTLGSATGVSADGRVIVGRGLNPSGQGEAWIARLSTPADLNNDGVVDGLDIGILLSQWMTAGSADLNGDGIVDGLDIGVLLSQWTM